MVQIDYFFATISPFAYLGGPAFQSVAEKHGAEVRFIPLDAPALFPRTGGQVLAERHDSRKAYRLQELRRQAVKAGKPLNLKPAFFPVNPAPSSYAVISAIKAGGGDLHGLVQAFGRAVWAEDRNIADDAVVKEILAASGFDPVIADRGMLMAAETYTANLEEAVARGVFGVPFFITGEEKFWGQDRIADLDLHLQGKL
jgi:2-hydroxychromene-2-carboxylate isomerase